MPIVSKFHRLPCRGLGILVLVLFLLLAGCDRVRDIVGIRPECQPTANAITKSRAQSGDAAAGQPAANPSPPPSFAAILDSFCGFDINGDSTIEIKSLKPLFTAQEPFVVTPQGVAIVFVDPRLVADDPSNGVTRTEMMLRLAQLRQDMFNDGYYPYFVRASVYAGARHQDGRTLLAMRRFLQKIRRHYPLRATLLVGSFPDAAIVRTVLVKEFGEAERPQSFVSGSSLLTNYTGDYLHIGSQLVTPRAEIVLADLDGNWEALYQEKLEFNDYRFLPSVPSDVYPFENQIVPTQTYTIEPRSYADVFEIADHNVAVSGGGGSLTFALRSLAEPNPETTAADRLQPNRIARAEIAVGRINPRSIAVQPYTDDDDIDGKQPLDASGIPQTLTFRYAAQVKWRRDATLERRLISDYIGRAHAFRLGSDRATPLRVSSMRGPDGALFAPETFNTILRRAFNPLIPVQNAVIDNANARILVRWLKRPAVLRGIVTHSDPVNSQFGLTSNTRGLEIEAGAYMPGIGVWRWHPAPNSFGLILVPTFDQMGTVANFHLYRTMWENKAMANAAQTFIVHDGCEVMRPAGAEYLPYNHENYGQVDDKGTVANGESLMFYTNVLGLMARNKVFNDTPKGFSEAIRSSGGRFGYGWAGYFAADAADTGLDERVGNLTTPDHRTRILQRKRSYFWNMIGDPTLKLSY